MAAYDLIDVELEHLHIDDVLFSPYPYEQQMVKYITLDGKQLTPNDASEIGVMLAGGTIKIEGMEKINRHVWDQLKRLCHDGPTTCHVFIATENSPSFPDHTDPDDVVLFVVSGEKIIVIDEVVHILGAGQSITIRAGTVHRAINKKASVMLSIGFEKFVVEKL